MRAGNQPVSPIFATFLFVRCLGELDHYLAFDLDSITGAELLAAAVFWLAVDSDGLGRQELLDIRAPIDDSRRLKQLLKLYVFAFDAKGLLIWHRRKL